MPNFSKSSQTPSETCWLKLSPIVSNILKATSSPHSWVSSGWEDYFHSDPALKSSFCAWMTKVQIFNGLSFCKQPHACLNVAPRVVAYETEFQLYFSKKHSGCQFANGCRQLWKLEHVKFIRPTDMRKSKTKPSIRKITSVMNSHTN